MNESNMVEAMYHHLYVLSKQLDCEHKMDEDTPGMMFVEWGRVEGPGLECPIGEARYRTRYPDVSSRYYTNLHELGHYAHGHTQGRPTTSRLYRGKVVEHPKGPQWYFDNGVLRSEAEAWEWAMDNGCYPPSAACGAFMWNTCMGSYYAGSRPGYRVRLGNGDRDYVVANWDAPDDFFWAIRERMLKEVQA